MDIQVDIVRRQHDPSIYEQLPPTWSPLMKRVLSSRDLQSTEEVSCSMKHLLSNNSLFGAEEAARLLAESIIGNRSILIVGDYDADGATATALSYLLLKSMGAKRLHYFSTDREEGYGLSESLVDKLHQTFEFDIMMTVDLGVSSHRGVARAKQLGYQVVITDHHQPSETLPEADCIVNPSLPNCQFPSKNLAGVGVAFYTLAKIRETLGHMNWFQDNKIEKPNLSAYLDLVAVGTIADVVSFDWNNRILVAHGLELIRRGKCRLGITSMLHRNKVIVPNVDCNDLAFKLIPPLNAMGRLENMKTGVDWLICDDYETAEKHTTTLNKTNNRRKLIEKHAIREAHDMIEQLQLNKEPCIVIHHERWHMGIIGILAGRLKEFYQKPVFVFCSHGEEFKGSGRSIEGINLYKIIAKSAKQTTLLSYGGHALAAGISVQKQYFPQLKRAINEAIFSLLAASGNIKKTIKTDGGLAITDFSLNTVNQIRKMPWGANFPSPLFDGEHELLWSQKMGEHSRFLVKIDDNRRVECIAFNRNISETHLIGEKLHLVYEIKEKHNSTTSRIQLLVQHVG